MAGTKRKKGRSGIKPAGEPITRYLASALISGDDFIITRESDPDGRQILHIMTGKLITPCMLGTLTNRCQFQEQDGSRHKAIPVR